MSELVSEAEFTKDGDGWHAWNNMSAEKEFVDFIPPFLNLVGAKYVVETGIGQGFTTLEIIKNSNVQTYIGFESDKTYREIAKQDPRLSEPFRVSDKPELTALEAEKADVTILDSGPIKRRLREYRTWTINAKLGSYVIIHDVRPDHPRNGLHRKLAKELSATQSGLLLSNPRGAWIQRKS